MPLEISLHQGLLAQQVGMVAKIQTAFRHFIRPRASRAKPSSSARLWAAKCAYSPECVEREILRTSALRSSPKFAASSGGWHPAHRWEGLDPPLASLRCEMGEQTATGICFPIRFGLWSVWSSPIRHRLGYGAQVGRKDSPAHPSIESFLTPIPATAQILAALHDADAPFYSSPKPPCPLEPSLPLVLLALLTFLPSFGQAYLLHPHLFC